MRLLFIYFLYLNTAFSQAIGFGTISPEGGNKSIQFNNDGTFAGAANVCIMDSSLKVLRNPGVTAPEDGLKIYASNNLYIRDHLAVGGAKGVHMLQPGFIQKSVALWQPVGAGATTTTALGMTGSTTGTATARNITTSTKFGQKKRLGYVSGTGANAAAAVFMVLNSHSYISSGSGFGGFYYNIQFGISDAVLQINARTAIGLFNSALAHGNNYSTATNCIFFGGDPGDTTLYLMHNDGVGNCTRINMGTDFPLNSVNNDWYNVTFLNVQGSGNIEYSITNMTTNISQTGILTTDIPSAGTKLGFYTTRSNAATGAAVAIDVGNIYIETDY